MELKKARSTYYSLLIIWCGVFLSSIYLIVQVFGKLGSLLLLMLIVFTYVSSQFSKAATIYKRSRISTDLETSKAVEKVAEEVHKVFSCRDIETGESFYEIATQTVDSNGLVLKVELRHIDPDGHPRPIKGDWERKDDSVQ